MAKVFRKTSALLIEALLSWANQVKQLFKEIRIISDIVEITESAINLQQAYLKAGILQRK